ncbi:MAG: hypothetical protein ABFR53_03545 [Actinomycetota bacterium]
MPRDTGIGRPFEEWLADSKQKWRDAGIDDEAVAKMETTFRDAQAARVADMTAEIDAIIADPSAAAEGL